MEQLETSIAHSLYQAAIDPEKLSEFLSVWDDYVTSAKSFQSSPNLQFSDNAEIIAFYARQVSDIVNLKKKIAPRDMQKFLDEKTYAAFVTNLRGKILQMNFIAVDRFQISSGSSIFDINIDAQSKTVLSRSIKQFQGNANLHRKNILPVRAFQSNARSVILTAEIISSEKFLDCSEPILILFKSCAPEWTTNSRSLIAESFGYTKAEINILQLLTEGFTSNQIASLRERSAQTIKKQISALLQKANVHSQSELVRLITGINHICLTSSEDSEALLPNWEVGKVFQQTTTTTLKDGIKVKFSQYGSRDGIPILFIAGNISPIAPKDFVYAIADQDIQIIAPFRLQADASTVEKLRRSPAQDMKVYCRLMRELGFDRIYLAGQCMGGIYCLEGYESNSALVKGIILVGTGAPIRTKKTIMDMPPTSQRTFLGVVENPEVVYASYAIAAELFFKDGSGKQTIMDIVYADSDIDSQLMKSKEMANIVERNLNYIFKDTKKTVDDLVLWMQDWAALHDRVAKHCPTAFIHGEHHDWLLSRDVVDFCRSRSNTNAHIISNTGQLMIYHKPEEVADKFRQIITSLNKKNTPFTPFGV